MAQKARKDRAKSNATALNNLHIGSLVVNGLFLFLHLFLRSRSLLLWSVLSIPSFLCQFALERTGRPSFDPTTRALKSAGEDLAAPGLTEYMFDVVWITWATAVLVVLFGNWAWIFWTVIPAYGGYKGFGLFGAARKMMGGGGGGGGGVPGMEGGGGGGAAAAPAGNRKQRRAAA